MRENNIKKTVLKLSTIALYIKLVGKKKYGYKYSVSKITNGESTLDTVATLGNMKIEVRSKEQGHNFAHFHVTIPSKEIDAVFKISPLEFYLGKIDTKSKKEILEWAKINRDILVEKWNGFHGLRIKVS